MRTLTDNYTENLELLARALRVNDSFDLLKKTLTLSDGELTFYYIDGFVKDAVMQKLMTQLLTLKKMPSSAKELMATGVPYVETDLTEDLDRMINAVMSGAALMIGTGLGSRAILIDKTTQKKTTP